MLKISLNGVHQELAKTISVAALLVENGYAQRRVAVEINHEIVPKSEHGRRQLCDGDRVEVVHAIGGG
ncbi:MAG: sulfur carrier protein ThiS [Rudaea sp.]